MAAAASSSSNLNHNNSQEEADMILSGASHLTRREVLRRRSQQLRQLANCYRDHYWALMEDLKLQYRHYYWKFGVSPLRRNNDDGRGFAVEDEDDNALKNSGRCAFVGCKFKAMALTCFCHLHILSDTMQKLYKPCNFVINRFVSTFFYCSLFMKNFS